MTVRVDGEWLRLEGECRVEEAETLASLLQQGGWRGVDFGQCRLAHGAVVQALLAFRIPVVAGGGSGFVTDFLVPALMQAQAAVERQARGETIEQPSEGGAPAPSS